LVIKALDPDWIRIRIGVHPKMLDPDPDELNADPQPCLEKYTGTVQTEFRIRIEFGFDWIVDYGPRTTKVTHKKNEEV